MGKGSREILTRRVNSDRMIQQTGYKREWREDNTLCVTIPSLPFEAIEGDKILPWNIMKVVDSGLFEKYFPLDHLNKLPLFYLICMEMEFDSSLYDHDAPKCPLLLEGKWKYAKTTSRSNVISLRHPTRIIPYVTGEYISVLVDPDTRKPITMPESWKLRHGIPTSGTKSEHIIPEKKATTVVFTIEHRVPYSDIDSNGHVNYGYYTKICYNSFVDNLISDKLENGADRWIKNGLRKLQVTFLSECLIGDVLTVESWRDDDYNHVYHFYIKKADKMSTQYILTDIMEKGSREILTRRFDIDRIKKQTGYGRELREDSTLVVTIPSLPFEAIEGEIILPWYFMKVVDSGLFHTYFPPEHQNKEPLLYLICMEMEFDSSLYDHDAPKCPLLLEGKWKYAKTTSRSNVISLRHPNRIKPYVTGEYISVLVDPDTRKPITLPESWKLRHGIPTSGTKSEHIIPEEKATTAVFTTEHRVPYSDIDSNGHVNYGYYTKICYNSFVENLISGKLENGAERWIKNGLRKLQVTFLSECLIGDVLTVESWKDDDFSHVYYFHVQKADKMCARLTFTFHKKSVKTLSHKL